MSSVGSWFWSHPPNGDGAPPLFRSASCSPSAGVGTPWAGRSEASTARVDKVSLENMFALCLGFWVGMKERMLDELSLDQQERLTYIYISLISCRISARLLFGPTDGWSILPMWLGGVTTVITHPASRHLSNAARPMHAARCPLRPAPLPGGQSVVRPLCLLGVRRCMSTAWEYCNPSQPVRPVGRHDLPRTYYIHTSIQDIFIYSAEGRGAWGIITQVPDSNLLSIRRGNRKLYRTMLRYPPGMARWASKHA